MKKYLIIFLSVVILILIVSTFLPKISREDTLLYLNSTEWIARQHANSIVLDTDLYITRVPFGVLVSTYEGMWFMPFWK